MIIGVRTFNRVSMDLAPNGCRLKVHFYANQVSFSLEHVLCPCFDKRFNYLCIHCLVYFTVYCLSLGTGLAIAHVIQALNVKVTTFFVNMQAFI